MSCYGCCMYQAGLSGPSALCLAALSEQRMCQPHQAIITALIWIWISSVFSAIACRGVEKDGKEFARPYTPVSLDSDVGHVDFVIKVQFVLFSTVSTLPSLPSERGSAPLIHGLLQIHPELSSLLTCSCSSCGVFQIYPEGAMSKYLSATEEGSFVAMRGPKVP